ncbi:DUF3833 domain-containing protein [Paraglaciecola aestuariivivens]
MISKVRYGIFIIIFSLFSCSQALDQYQHTQPEFKLQAYFNGQVTAWGIVQDYSNKLSRRFCVDIIGTWQGNAGQLHETFYFNDGEKQIRIWQLKINEQGEVTGTADDVIGIARGQAQGAAFNWQYTLRVPVEDSVYNLFVDDWIYVLDEQRLMNRSYLKKLGVTVAEISLFFDKSAPIKSCKPN